MDKYELQTIIDEVKRTLPSNKWSSAIRSAINETKEKVQTPEPENIEVDDYTRAIAERLCNEHFSTEKAAKVLISQFVREDPKLESIKIDVQNPNRVIKNFKKGNLIGALVAFKSNSDVRIGWSLYNKNHEVLPFTRKNAVRVAIIRGLMDGVDGNHTTSGIRIPECITKVLPDFVRRVTKYYFTKPVNTS